MTGLMGKGAKLLEKAAPQTFTHPLKLLTPGEPSRTWDEAAEEYVDTPGTPTLEREILGSLQPVIQNSARPGTTETALVQEEQATYRAYLPASFEVTNILLLRGLYLVDDAAGSLTYGNAFRLLKPPARMAGMGSYRLDLKEA